VRADRLSSGTALSPEIATGWIVFVYKTAPGQGVWLNGDPLREGGGINLYQFCGGDPINGIDPWGLEITYSYSRRKDLLLSPPGIVPYLEGDTAIEQLAAGTYNAIPLVFNGVTSTVGNAFDSLGQLVAGGGNIVNWGISKTADHALAELAGEFTEAALWVYIVPAVTEAAALRMAPRPLASGSTQSMLAKRVAAKEAGALTYNELRQAGVNLTDRMSGNQFRKLVESIKQNGLQDKVINFVKVGYENYVVLGNNRLQAARQLGITDQLIFKEAQLPFRGFKTENDVINAAAEVVGGH